MHAVRNRRQAITLAPPSVYHPLQLEQARKGMEEVALAAAHEAEERTLLQYQQVGRLGKR